MSEHDNDHHGDDHSGSDDGQVAAKVGSSPLVIGAAWALVSIPLAYGLYETMLRAANLFSG